MTRISNSEAVLAIVRAQLQRMAKSGKAGKTARTAKTETKSLSSRQMVRALDAIEGLSEEDFTRGFVRALLTEELGEKLSQSAGFQSVVDRTASALREDADVRNILTTLRGHD